MIHTCIRLISAILIILVSSSQVFAQNISGKITDETEIGLPGVTVELRSEKDSSLSKVSVSDGSGNYALEGIKAGKYFIKSTLIGFETNRSATINFDGTNNISLPAIKLKTSSVQLSEAVVTGIKPLIEIKSDKTVFNIENSINATGSTAYELLQKSPGVVVDNNDNVLIKGRSGVMIQIDGKNSQLSEAELADYLKSIQSTDVEAIEIISNPSSKYDAEGTAGIINIRLKKNKNFGTNGTVTAGYVIGIYSKYNTSFTLNNRSKNLNLFATYSNNWGDRQNEFYLYREQFPFIFDAVSISKRWGLSQNYKAGADYTINSHHTVGLMVTGNYSDINSMNRSTNEIYHFNSDIKDSVLKSDQAIKGFSSNFNANFNHHYSDTSGHDLTTDLDIGRYSGDRNNYQPNIYTLPDGQTILSSRFYRSITPTTIDIYTLKSDYSHNLFKGKLGAGYKLSYVKTDNTFDFFNIINDAELIDNSRSNRFEYTEKVTAAYINFQRTINKLDIQAGVRMENTSSVGDLKSAADTVQNKNVKRNYTDFFPSAGLTLNLNTTSSFSLIYSKRIDRPNYQELNPFEYKLDELSYIKGNPFLNPQYSDKLDLSYTYKYSTTLGVGYSFTKDFFAQINDTISNGSTAMTPRNLAEEKVLSLDLSSSYQITKWYGIYIHAGLYNQKYNADFGNGRTVNSSVTNFNLYGQNTFKLPADFTFEISGWYNSAGIWGGTFVTRAQGSLDLGLQKKLLQDQMTIRLAYTDILYTAPWSSYNVYSGLVILASGNWESRVFRASVTWRFGNKQLKSGSQRKSGSESEMKRISGEQ